MVIPSFRSVLTSFVWTHTCVRVSCRHAFATEYLLSYIQKNLVCFYTIIKRYVFNLNVTGIFLNSSSFNSFIYLLFFIFFVYACQQCIVVSCPTVRNLVEKFTMILNMNLYHELNCFLPEVFRSVRWRLNTGTTKITNLKIKTKIYEKLVLHLRSWISIDYGCNQILAAHTFVL